MQIGNKDDTNVQGEHCELAGKILDEYYSGFIERNPQLRVFSAHLHLDEETPHLHIDFVPFMTGSKRGLDTRVTLKQALAMQGFKGGSREETEWSQWVQSEKEVLADVMKRHGVEWLQLGKKREHLSVLDYKKEQRTKEIAELESKLADKKDEFEVYQDRISNYSKGEQVIEELAKKLDTEPDYQLQEPPPLMSAKSYKTKFVEPLIKKLREVISSVMSMYYQALYSKPFLKWAGGKGQLIKEIERYYPFDSGRITKYAEPFVGGGAVLFDILSKYDLEEVYISDINAELINTYHIIRDDIDALIEILYAMQNDFIPLDTDNRKAYYMEKRERFNDLKVNGNENINIEKAALMIFLNKTCFNGLFRVNKKGLFNVPMGAYKNPMICDENNLRAVSEKLQRVNIVCGDYRESADFIDENTFVYFDPPYRPITDTASFTAYTENLFNDEEQIELARFVDDMHRKGAKVVISNSDPKNSNTDDDFFDNIYSAHKIKRVEATRMINCNSEARGKIKELLISNF